MLADQAVVAAGMREHPGYVDAVREAVSANVVYRIDEGGVITVGPGTIKSVQAVVMFLREWAVPYSWHVAGDDVRKEIRRRLHMLQPEITTL